MAASAGEQKPRARRWPGFVVGLVLGLIVVVILPAIWPTRESGSRRPRLTRAAFDEASLLWAAHGPANYNLDIEVSGNRPGKIHVEVRQGEAVHMVRDGVEPRQRRVWYYWTVPGMLDTIGQELDKVDDPVRGFGAPAGAAVILRATFDDELGYPLSYSRSVAGQNLDMGWTVKAFDPVEPPTPAESDDEKATSGENDTTPENMPEPTGERPATP